MCPTLFFQHLSLPGRQVLVRVLWNFKAKRASVDAPGMLRKAKSSFHALNDVGEWMELLGIRHQGKSGRQWRHCPTEPPSLSLALPPLQKGMEWIILTLASCPVLFHGIFNGCFEEWGLEKMPEWLRKTKHGITIFNDSNEGSLFSRSNNFCSPTRS